MRALPEQVIHLPFVAGPYRMAMDLVTVAEAAWFELDQRYPEEMAERRRLLDSAHADVFAAEPGSADARAEALEMIVAALTTYHAGWFSRDGSVLRNHLTGEVWDLAAGVSSGPVEAEAAFRSTPGPAGPAATESGMIDPLELAGRLLQDDLCVIQDSDGGPRFTAAVLCFPSRWRLLDKIGRPLSAVHGPVPFYADRLARPVERFMRHLKAGPVASRLNWSVLDDPILFQPEGKWRASEISDITMANAATRLFLRVERQTLRRLPRSGAVLFGIRVHVYPLEQAVGRTEVAASLAAAVRALPAETLHYKSVLPFRDALLAWLDRR